MLGLLTASDPRWIDTALENYEQVLVDHLHCELKAASNATSLIARYPHERRLVHELSALAREELEHVTQVFDQLQQRGVRAHPPDPDPYALALRKVTAAKPSYIADGLLDRLTVGALIEARSCERFSLLKDRAPTPALRAWYADLFASEARHYRLFASLAEEVAGEEIARERITWLAKHEAEILADLPLVARVH